MYLHKPVGQEGGDCAVAYVTSDVISVCAVVTVTVHGEEEGVGELSWKIHYYFPWFKNDMIVLFFYGAYPSKMCSIKGVFL